MSIQLYWANHNADFPPSLNTT